MSTQTGGSLSAASADKNPQSTRIPVPSSGVSSAVARSTAAAQTNLILRAFGRSAAHLSDNGSGSQSLGDASHPPDSVIDVHPGSLTLEDASVSCCHPSRVDIAIVVSISWSVLSVLVAVYAEARLPTPLALSQIPLCNTSGSGAGIVYNAFCAPSSLIQGVPLVIAFTAISCLVWLTVLGHLVGDVKAREVALFQAVWACPARRAAFLVSCVFALSVLCFLVLLRDSTTAAFIWCECIAILLVEVVTSQWNSYEALAGLTGASAERTAMLRRFRSAALQCGAIAIVLGCAAISMLLINDSINQYSVYLLFYPSFIALKAASLYARVALFAVESTVPNGYANAARQLFQLALNVLFQLTYIDSLFSGLAAVVYLCNVIELINVIVLFASTARADHLYHSVRRCLKTPTVSQHVDSLECGICGETSESSDGDGASLNVLPQCGHAFHWNCLGPWVKRGHNTCPTCRGVIMVGWA